MNSLLSNLRLSIVRMIKSGGEGHIPSSFSIVDLIYGVYKFGMRKSGNAWIDKFVLSKGHGAAALYVVLAELNIISKKYLQDYGKPGSLLGGHPDRSKIPGVEANTGSLGHGMPYAVGLALGAKILEKDERIFCLVGDGECQEGTIWESANIASNNFLGNLVVLVDWNGSAVQLQPIENMKSKWEAFGWEIYECEGNSLTSIEKIFSQINYDSDKPKVILARTIKGFGVSFLQGHGIWHHKIPNDDEMRIIEMELKS